MKKILIADDQDETRELLQVTLEFDGYQIITAENKQQTLEMAQAEHPELLLLDIMMPDSRKAGLEVCHQLKNDPITADIAIVIVSAKGQKEDIEAGKEAGADAYFVKPFSPIALIKKVEEVMDGAW
jgi:CheY-like chemotaxis protein